MTRLRPQDRRHGREPLLAVLGDRPAAAGDQLSLPRFVLRLDHRRLASFLVAKPRRRC
jgi:hypothetical protein